MRFRVFLHIDKILQFLNASNTKPFPAYTPIGYVSLMVTSPHVGNGESARKQADNGTPLMIELLLIFPDGRTNIYIRTMQSGG